MLLALTGQRVRCASCGHRFEIGAAEEPQVERLPPLEAVPVDDPPRPEAEPSWPEGDRYPPRRFNIDVALRPLLEDEEGLPYCPGCGRRVRWEAYQCPHCEEEFEDDSDLRRQRRRSGGPARRDTLPHRGSTIARMGTASLALGMFSICFGLTAVVGLPLGIIALVLANNDLEAMNNGVLDPRGRRETSSGRGNAIAGVVFCGLFAGTWLLLWFWTH